MADRKPTDPRPTDSRIEVLERTPLYQGFYSVEKYRLRHHRFDGTWSKAMSREVFVRPAAAAVLPYDPARDAVVLIEQFRIGAYVAGAEPWLIEVVAGIIESGEAPEEVARREAVEEAGCHILALEPIGRILPSPGADSELMHLYSVLRPHRQHGHRRRARPGPRARGYPRLGRALHRRLRPCQRGRRRQRHGPHHPAMAGPQPRSPAAGLALANPLAHHPLGPIPSALLTPRLTHYKKTIVIL